MAYTMGSLFAGIGGFDLGFERAGFKTNWQVEIDPYCQKVLAKNFPEAERYGDITCCGFENLAIVDVVTGGFPCQDVSHAGRRIGIDGARSSLWREMRRIIRELQPRFAVVENTSGLLDRGMERVLGEMAEDGLDAEWTVFPACAFGAPHPRNRVFIVAYPAGQRPGQLRGLEREEESATHRDLHWQESEPSVCRVADGVPNRLERLTAIGNAVVPQIPEMIARRIKQALDSASAT
jgi:DNA (cytosine-5)-methyltransferase 1